MIHRFVAPLGALVAVISIVSLTSAPAAAQAQTTAADTSTPPRTPDGRPDLQGIWSFATITPLERPDELAGQAFLTDEDAAEIEERQAQRRLLDPLPRPGVGGGGGAYNQAWYDPGTKVVETRRTSLIVNPPDGKIPPLTPEAQTRVNARRAARERPAHGPEDRGVAERCILGFNAGPPMNPSAYNNNMQLFHTPDYVVILTEMVHDTRVVPLNARAHLPEPIRQWKGDSRGHWDGDTLVVDTTNFTVDTPFRGSGRNMHLMERFTRVDADTLLYEYTLDNPESFASSWS